MSSSSDIIFKIDEHPAWTLEVGRPGESKTVAKFTGGAPPPRVGDTVVHEDVDRPMTVVAVVWGVHRKYPYSAEVFVQ